MAEQQLFDGIKLSGDWTDNAEITRVWLWDMGPEKPAQPKKPQPPHGKNGDPEYELAKVEFGEELEDYQAALKAFKKAKDEYADWVKKIGGPLEVMQDSVNAKEAIANDARAVAEGRQTKPRWYVSSRTRGHSRVPNRGLPEGAKPGHGQADQERRIAEGESDLIAARKADPVFGQTELRG
jgi:hypothetical protein